MNHATAFVQWITSSPVIYRGGWTLLHSFWELAAVAGMLAGGLRLLGQASSHLRYLVSTLALGLMVALPVVTFETLAGAPSPPALLPSGVSTSLGASAGSSSLKSLSGGSREVVATGQPGARSVGLPTARGQEPSYSLWLTSFAAWLVPLVPWIVFAWALGVLALSVWHLGGWVATQRLRSLGVSAASPELVSLLSGLAVRLGLAGPVRIAKSTLVQIPIVIGSLRPLILVPASVLAGLPADQLEAILAHELAHIRRHDYFVNLLQALVETLLFYHPAVWWVSRQIRQERENCCDDVAVSICGNRRLYAEALVSVQELRAPERSLILAATGGGGSMLARIQRLVGFPRHARPGRSAPLAAVILSLGLFLVPLLHQRTSAQGAAAAEVRAPDPKPDGSAAPYSNSVQPFHSVDVDMRWGDYRDYLARVMRSVQGEWRKILVNTSDYPPPGTIAIKFRLDSHGRIAAILDHSTQGTDEHGADASMAALTNPAPYGAWTPDMIAILGDSQDMTFTFHYRKPESVVGPRMEPVVAALIPPSTDKMPRVDLAPSGNGPADSTGGEMVLRGYASGYAHIWDGSMVFAADEIHYNRTALTVKASGNVVWTSGSGRMFATSLAYDRRQHTLKAENVRVGLGPFLVTGLSADGTVGRLEIHHATITDYNQGEPRSTHQVNAVIYSPGHYLRVADPEAEHYQMDFGLEIPTAPPLGLGRKGQ